MSEPHSLLLMLKSHPIILSCVAIPIIIYASALYFPQFLHEKRPPLAFKIKHSSHRGGGGENPENTIVAFRHARDVARSDLLELDVHLTRDGQVVVLHDADLERDTGVDAVVSDYNYADLPLVEGKEKIPLLEEVFRAFPDAGINLDIKAADDELLVKTHDLIKKYKREKLTIWGSGFTSAEWEKKLYKRDPTIPHFFSAKRILKIYLWHYFCILPFMPLHETAFEIPLMKDVWIKFLLPNSSAFTQKALAWIFRRIILSNSLLRHLQRRGIVIILWTPNSVEEFEAAKKAKVDSIMTDYPKLLRDWMDKEENNQ